MSHSEVTKPTDIHLPDSSLWAKLPMLGGVLALLGVGSTLAVAAGEGGERAMFSYLWAFECFLAIALGGLGWLLIDHMARSHWSTVVRRIGEVTGATLPVFLVLFIPIAVLGFHTLYPWTHEHDEILAKKTWFLSNGFFFLRAGFYFVVWCFLGFTLHKISVQQDTTRDPAERDRLSKRVWMMAPPGIILWALTLSFQAIDWLMSLQPHWYSTIFGVYFFAAATLSFFAFMTLVALALQSAGVLKDAITTEHYHDLGKFVFGFTIFWAYIAFSQLILIWYANMPEETEFFMVRVEGGWKFVSYFLPFGHFFIPFLYLLSRRVKRSKAMLAVGCVWILFVHCVDIYWLVLPTLGHGEHHAPFMPSWLDVTAFLGVGGAFLAVFSSLLKRNSVVCINDPRLEESLAHENY